MFCELGFSQDSIKRLPEVSISPIFKEQNQTNSQSQTISSKQIELLQPEDLGTLLQKTSGTSIKSYGGLGGLKTISIRGLNSQHSTFVQDGFLLQNAQTGQVNLGQMIVDNISEVSLNRIGRQSFLLPVSAYLKGNLITVYNKNNQFENKEFSSSNFKLGIGSFGQYDTYLSSKHEKKYFLISSYVKFRRADGDYNFKINNGTLDYKGERLNNDLKDKYGGVTLAYRLKNNAILRTISHFKEVEQGLPGAVIIYNPIANQRLNTNQYTTQIDFTHFHKKLYYRFYSTYSKDKLNYVDPTFLNNSGGINTTYTNDFFNIGVSFQRRFKTITTYGGIETKYNTLSFSNLNSNSPKRSSNFMLLGTNYKIGNFKFDVQVSGQGILESNNKGEKAKDVYRVNPYFSIERVSLKPWKLSINAWFRNSFRMPSFNELYYNNIGNVDLKPESVNQFSLGISMLPFANKLGIEMVVNTFYSEVDNQILALPTKNLFVWSMQNIGKVKNYGAESRVSFSKQIKKDWKFNLSMNYTLQFALDFSNSSSPTYKNQIAYMPKHTGNFDFGISYKSLGFTSSIIRVSKRYSLNENIVSNEVPEFVNIDLGLYLNHKMLKDNNLRVQFMVKNLINESYSYVRYFVMPGRNYLITLSYALQ